MKKEFKECDKKVHFTRAGAKKALKVQKRQHRGAREKSIYYCEPCSGWHLTSMSSENNRNLKNWKDKNLEL